MIKMKIFLTLFLCSTWYAVIFGNDPHTVVANFDSLRNEADAVVLNNYSQFKIITRKSAEYTFEAKILIKNKNADEFCRVELKESEFSTIEDIEAVIKSLDGEIIKELDSDDIHEAEVTSDKHSDELYNWFELTHNSYPYIFEFRIKKEYNTLFFWPDWYPQNSIPVLHSEYNLINKAKVKFDYKAKGIDFTPAISNQNSVTNYKWVLKNIPEYDPEDFSSPESAIKYSVEFKPKNFTFNQYKGRTESWKEFGKFYYSLAKNRYEITPKMKAKIQELIKGKTNEKEIVEILYKHLQDHNRYVAIEFGVRGWQPEYAKNVFTYGYGDCKDLSTYMVAILKEAGITAYPALALSRNKGAVDIDFPSNQFNHCISMVPLKQDTLWLECTSTYGYYDNTPYNIENINALVVDKSGGKIITTSQKSASENSGFSLINGKLDKNGYLQFNAEIKFKGNQEAYVNHSFKSKNSKDDKLYLKNLLDNNYSNVVINKYDILERDKNNPVYKISVEGRYNKFVSTRGKRLFVCPSIINRKTKSHLPDESVEERETPIFFYYPYLDVDSVSIEIPERYKLESMPKDKSIETSFGKYEAKYYMEGNTIKYKRYFERKQNNIPLEQYEEYLKFENFVIKADKAKFVLKR